MLDISKFSGITLPPGVTLLLAAPPPAVPLAVDAFKGAGADWRGRVKGGVAFGVALTAVGALAVPLTAVDALADPFTAAGVFTSALTAVGAGAGACGAGTEAKRGAGAGAGARSLGRRRFGFPVYLDKRKAGC